MPIWNIGRLKVQVILLPRRSSFWGILRQRISGVEFTWVHMGRWARVNIAWLEEA